MKWTIVPKPTFEPITVTITIESREELKEVVDVIGKARSDTPLAPIYRELSDRLNVK